MKYNKWWVILKLDAMLNKYEKIDIRLDPKKEETITFCYATRNNSDEKIAAQIPFRHKDGVLEKDYTTAIFLGANNEESLLQLYRMLNEHQIKSFMAMAALNSTTNLVSEYELSSKTKKSRW